MVGIWVKTDMCYNRKLYVSGQKKQRALCGKTVIEIFIWQDVIVYRQCLNSDLMLCNILVMA